MLEKTKKQKRLESLRDLIKAGKLTTREHERLAIEDTDGQSIQVMSDGALEAIERRLAQIAEEG